MNNRILVGILITGALIIGGFFLWRNPTTQSSSQTLETQQISDSTQSGDIRLLGSECTGKVTSTLTEGPYYKTGSPVRTNLREEEIPGEKLTLTGFVFDQDCKPIANAWLDFWQADGEGNYDNQGFKLRGHQFTEAKGKYILETVIPGEYPGRTPHIHVKVRANENSPIITSQLFLPGTSQNQTDSIFNEALVMNVKDTIDGKVATFNFVIPK